MNQNNSYVIYSAGETGKQVVDILLENKQQIIAIFDRNSKERHYKGIGIIKLEEWQYHSNIESVICVLALHNHYINPKPIYEELKKFGFAKVWNMVEFSNAWSFPDKYWLSSAFSYEGRLTQLERILPLLADEQSKSILLGAWTYWQNGDLKSCPEPSLDDEYAPIDVPRYPKTLRLIDCGASSGSALTKLTKAGYDIEAVMAFEPDPINFKKLTQKTEDFDLIPLPLGLWSSEVQLKFTANSDNSLASRLDSGGSNMIQCVSLDNVAINFNPNLIKFDIEGSELEVLSGAKNLIKKYRPDLCVSVYHRPGDPLDIFDLLETWKLGYSYYYRCHEYNTYGLILYCIKQDGS